MTALPRTHLRLAAACATLVLVVAAPAQAQPAPPAPGASGVEQYRELVPGAGGPSAPGVGATERTPLPRAGEEALADAPPGVANALQEVATSSEYGAPTSSGEAGTAGGANISTDATLESTLSAIGSASDARVLGLLLAVLSTTVAAVALAFGRRRAP